MYYLFKSSFSKGRKQGCQQSTICVCLFLTFFVYLIPLVTKNTKRQKMLNLENRVVVLSPLRCTHTDQILTASLGHCSSTNDFSYLQSALMPLLLFFFKVVCNQPLVREDGSQVRAASEGIRWSCLVENKEYVVLIKNAELQSGQNMDLVLLVDQLFLIISIKETRKTSERSATS